MFLLWLLLALSMWSTLVTIKGRVVDNTLPFEFGLDAFIGRNCCKVLGPETLMIQVTLELVTPPCHSVNAKKSIHSVNPLTVTRCHSLLRRKNISATFFLRTQHNDSSRPSLALAELVAARLVTEAQVDLTTRERVRGSRVVPQFETQRRVRSRERGFPLR